MAPDQKELTAALNSVFSRNGHARGPLAAVYQEPSPYTTTFPCEAVTCRFHDGSEFRLFCKYGPSSGASSHGHRGGIGYEVKVYRNVLKPFGISAPLFYGSYSNRKTGGTWLILEHLGGSWRAGKIPGLIGMKLAARWIGEFHAANEKRAGHSSLSFLTTYDRAYYQGWPRRASRLAHRMGLPVPWLATLCNRLETEVTALAALPQTMIHGEYYSHNVMFQEGMIRPVDWETAALAPGEIDLAMLTDGWPQPDSRELEMEYQRARWPSGAPADFQRNLDLARAYMQLRWLGDDDNPKATGDMTRWERLRAVSQRLELL